MIANDRVEIIFALQEESQGLFEKAGYSVHYSGMGKINAAFRATEVILTKKPKLILNLGTAGSFRFPAKTLIECSGFVQRDFDLTSVGGILGKTPFDSISDFIEGHPPMFNLPQGVCGSGDNVEIGTTRLPCDLMDMEAYAIAKVCKKLNVPFVSLKFISDGSDHSVKNDFRTNLPFAAQALLDVVNKGLS